MYRLVAIWVSSSAFRIHGACPVAGGPGATIVFPDDLLVHKMEPFIQPNTPWRKNQQKSFD